MKVFYKVLEAIKGKTQNGHAIANAKNIISLTKADKEIKKMIGESKW